MSNRSASQAAVQRGKVINLQSHKSKTTSLQLSLSFGFQAPFISPEDYQGRWGQLFADILNWVFGILMTLRKRYFLKKLNVILILLLETILRFAIKATISYLNSIFSGETVSQEYQSLKISALHINHAQDTARYNSGWDGNIMSHRGTNKKLFNNFYR